VLPRQNANLTTKKTVGEDVCLNLLLGMIECSLHAAAMVYKSELVPMSVPKNAPTGILNANGFKPPGLFVKKDLVVHQ
jgi:hypothetical protein